jgi:hypothetical protein
MTTELIALTNIVVDERCQFREALDWDYVNALAEDLARGDTLPPVDLFYNDETYWLSSGFHRFHAAERARHTHIEAKIHQGGLREAILFAAGSNSRHGLRRSNADKRKAVMALLADDEWSTWSDREIARRCQVNHELVGRLRPKDVSGGTASEKRVYKDKHGNVGVMDTSRIGHRIEAEATTDAPVPFEGPDIPKPQFGREPEPPPTAQPAHGSWTGSEIVEQLFALEQLVQDLPLPVEAMQQIAPADYPKLTAARIFAIGWWFSDFGHVWRKTMGENDA